MLAQRYNTNSRSTGTFCFSLACWTPTGTAAACGGVFWVSLLWVGGVERAHLMKRVCRSLPDKLLFALRFAHTAGYDFFFKTDDDVLVNVDA
jgi:hypothetical protein